MNVEGGPSGSVASAGPSLGVGSLALGREFGRVMTAADIGPITRDGLVRGGLENTMPYIFNDSNLIRGENRFNIGIPIKIQESVTQPSVPEVLTEAELILDQGKRFVSPIIPLVEEDAIAEAEHILGLGRPKVDPEFMMDPDLPKLQAVTEIITAPQTQPDFLRPLIPASALELDNTLVAQVSTQPQTESKVSYKTVQAEPTSVPQEQAVQQVETGERVTTETREKDIQEHEEVGRVKVLHVIDKKQVIKREKHIVEVGLLLLGKAKIVLREKVKQVKIKGIDMIGHLLPSNKAEIRGGEINSKDPEEKLPDKTWDSTIEKIGELAFTSEDELKQKVPTIVESNHPVTIATNGEAASQENIVKSHKATGGSNHGVLEFEKRKKLKKEQIIVVKNGQPVQIIPIHEEIVEKNEGILHPEVAAALLVPKDFQK